MITGKCKYIQLVLNGAKTDIIDKTGILKCHDEYIFANKVKLYRPNDVKNATLCNLATPTKD